MLRIPTVLLLLGSSGLLAYGAAVAEFRARQQATGVLLEWRPAPAADVRDYELLRRDSPTDDFDRLAVFTATTQDQYRYTDAAAPSGGPVTYRLVARSASGIYAYHTQLAPAPDNLVVRSWDTIKQMFR